MYLDYHIGLILLVAENELNSLLQFMISISVIIQYILHLSDNVHHGLLPDLVNTSIRLEHALLLHHHLLLLHVEVILLELWVLLIIHVHLAL